MISKQTYEGFDKQYALMLEALDEVAPHNKELYFSVRGWLRSFYEAGYGDGQQDAADNGTRSPREL